MLKQSLRILAYFSFSIICGIASTLLVDKIVNVSVEKELRRGLEREVRSAAASFRESAQHPTPDEVMLFVEKFAAGAMNEKIVANDPTIRDFKGRKGVDYLFSFTDTGRRLDLFIRDDYLKAELDILDTPELIFGVITTVSAFLFITLYSEKKKHALLIEQKLEETHQEYRRALEEHEALALLGRMAATLAHELKTPLATISNLIQILPSRLTDEKFTRRFVAITGEELHRTQQLIDNLLVYGKEIDIVNEEWIAFEPFIAELAPIHGIRVEVSPLFSILGDRFYLRLLFENLLRNSREAGSDKVRIRPAIDLAEGDLAAISLEDNGSGFPEGIDLAGLLDPFVTLRSSGGGLGLYLVNKIAHAHRGRVELYRAPSGAGITLLFQKNRIRCHESS